MDETKNVITGVVIGVVTALLGGYDITLRVLLVLMLLDILTGVYKGIYQSDFSSRAFRKGLLGKSGFILVLILCYQLDLLMGNSEPVIRNVGTIFYIAVEGTSIIENLGAIGVPIPQAVKNRLSKLKDDADNEEPQDNE